MTTKQKIEIKIVEYERNIEVYSNKINELTDDRRILENDIKNYNRAPLHTNQLLKAARKDKLKDNIIESNYLRGLRLGLSYGLKDIISLLNSL